MSGRNYTTDGTRLRARPGETADVTERAKALIEACTQLGQRIDRLPRLGAILTPVDASTCGDLDDPMPDGITYRPVLAAPVRQRRLRLTRRR